MGMDGDVPAEGTAKAGLPLSRLVFDVWPAVWDSYQLILCASGGPVIGIR